MAERFKCFVVSPAGKVFSGEVWQVAGKNRNGGFALRAHHENCMTTLVPGTFEIAEQPDSRKTFSCGAAILSFIGNTCTIVGDRIEPVASAAT